MSVLDIELPRSKGQPSCFLTINRFVLLPYYQQFLPSLSLLISHHNLYLQTNSLKLLISLSENDELLQSLLEANIINRIMELLIDKEDRNHKLEIILLANLSRSDIGSSLLMRDNSIAAAMMIPSIIYHLSSTLYLLTISSLLSSSGGYFCRIIICMAATNNHNFKIC
jgi:hypothetical protein